LKKKVAKLVGDREGGDEGRFVSRGEKRDSYC